MRFVALRSMERKMVAKRKEMWWGNQWMSYLMYTDSHRVWTIEHGARASIKAAVTAREPPTEFRSRRSIRNRTNPYRWRAAYDRPWVREYNPLPIAAFNNNNIEIEFVKIKNINRPDNSQSQTRWIGTGNTTNCFACGSLWSAADGMLAGMCVCIQYIRKWFHPIVQYLD